MKLYKIAFSSLLLAGLTSGCVVVREHAPQKEAVKASKEEYELARQLLLAFIKDDGKKFISLLPEETRSKFTMAVFKSTRKSIVESVGTPIACSYLTTLKLPALRPQIWKVTFRRENVNRTKEFTSEILFKVVTGKTGKNKAVITGFQFI